MSDGRTKRDEMRVEYDFRGGVRGKYFERYQQGTNVVVIAPDLVEEFPDSDSVNEALRRRAWRPAPSDP